MVKHFSIDKQIDLTELSKHFEAKLGIKLHADKENDIVNGSLFANYHPAGPKTGECWCGMDLSEIPGEHTCIIVKTYEVDEPQNLLHKTKFKKPVKTKERQIPTEFDEYLIDKKAKGKEQKGSKRLKIIQPATVNS